ncbi:hypothetical protein [Primorskyibacter marinus]|uniref:hypothetical protein n=1 Tax=Primorskyibacter marinus TaxID=1977320 RepID=UPI000E305AE0|nr:hypothetical protein [Primorskyibacter marinus]
MSAPQTNVETQEKNHRPALGAMKFAVGAALVLFIVFVIWMFAAGDDPEGAETQIDGRTGEVEQAE